MARILLLLILSLAVPTVSAETPLVAIASNMTHVMQEIADQYRKDSHEQIKLTFGSSGNFARQIQQGAPYDIFLSAAGKYVDILAERDLLSEAPRAYARGRIGFFIPRESRLGKLNGLKEIVNHLYYGDFQRIAYANPDYAPYGVAARQALQNGGVWAMEKKKTLIAENAAQVAQYVLSGSVDAGVIPESFARLPGIRDNGRFIAIPESWHEPITQYLVLIKGSGKNSRDFFEYLTSEQALEIVRQYGYSTGGRE